MDTTNRIPGPCVQRLNIWHFIVSSFCGRVVSPILTQFGLWIVKLSHARELDCSLLLCSYAISVEHAHVQYHTAGAGFNLMHKGNLQLKLEGHGIAILS